MACPVLTSRIVLRICYHVSGTDAAAWYYQSAVQVYHRVLELAPDMWQAKHNLGTPQAQLAHSSYQSRYPQSYPSRYPSR
eukprot:3717967-Rhodomonas_salina.2